MQSLKLDLENCFGITKLLHTFVFTDNNSSIIYAPNGMMKSSLAKTFDCIAKANPKDMPCDRIHPEKGAKYNVLCDDVAITPQSILVVNAETDINSEDRVTTLLASKELKTKYDQIYQYLEGAKAEFLKKLKGLSQSTDCEGEMIEVFRKNPNDDLFNCVIEAAKYLGGDYQRFNFRYNLIFDKGGKVEKFLDKHKDLFAQYFADYYELLSQSKLFKSGGEKSTFGTYQAKILSSSVADDAFFNANHKLILDGGLEITSAEDFDKIIEAEIAKIISDKKLKATFDKIDKAIAGNDDLRKFKEVIERHNELIPYLTDYKDFREKVWLGYLCQLKTEVSELTRVYSEKSTELEDILKKANEESAVWTEIISIFKDRFYVPFDIYIANKEDVILKQKAATIGFRYIDNDNNAVDQNKDELLKLLSRGERRALFILQMLFEIEARKRSADISLVVLDDIADSFDYKNKYAIIEYIEELNHHPNFRLIILTHNFDFYRTIDSRLGLKKLVFMATKAETSEILLKPGNYRKDAFKGIFLKNMNEVSHFLSLIPFVRNIIEYTKGNSDTAYQLLTDCLHIKQTSVNITANDILCIIQNNIHGCTTQPINFGHDNIIELIINTADRLIAMNPYINETILSRKFVLSMAIRLTTEKYVIKELNKISINTSAITNNQTAELIRLYTENYSLNKRQIAILKRVSIMTPEYIHVNTFMYEPLIDISALHLAKLYNDVKLL